MEAAPEAADATEPMASTETPTSLRARFRVIVALLLVLLLADAVAGSVLAGVRRHQRTVISNRLVPAQIASARLLKDYVDEETGLRGYVITGSRDFLEPLDAGRAD